ncbi:MAG: hypothetical protein FJ090_07415 [Deltaproteobacteria bacterium]|nr:hypothetical protein [Deltaproteobacteria bacterium]
MQLPAPVERFFERAQEVTARVIAAVQPVVVSVFLFVIYVVGVGLTKLGCMLFRRDVLHLDQAVETDGSFWRPAQGYELDPQRLRKQA